MPDVIWLDDGKSPAIIAKEVLGTRRINYSLNNISSFTVTVEVDASSASSFCERMLAWMSPLPTAIGLKFDYLLTDAQERYVDSRITYLDGAQVISYSGKALVDLTYQALPGKRVVRLDEYYSTTEGVFYHEEEVKPSSIFYPMPANALVWGKLLGEGTPLYYALAPGEEPPLSMPRATLVRTIKGFTSVNPNWTELIGTVNNAVYSTTFDTDSYAIGQLLLRSIDVKRTNNNFNSSSLSITVVLTYEYSYVGWNLFYHIDVDPNMTGWFDLRYASDTTSVYEPFPEADHGDFLF